MGRSARPEKVRTYKIFSDSTFFASKSLDSIDKRYFIVHEDSMVAVHVIWHNKGFRYPARFKVNPNTKYDTGINDWCSEHAPTAYLYNPMGAVLFKDEGIATAFRLTW